MAVDPGADRALITELIRRESERGERLVSRIRAVMHSVMFSVGLIALFAIELDPAWRSMRTLMVWLAPFVLGTIWGWSWFVHSRPYRRLYGLISVAGDVLTLAAATAAASLLLGESSADVMALGAGPPLLGLFFVLAGAGIRQDPGLCVFAGALALVSFGIAAVISRATAGPLVEGPGVGLFASTVMWVGRGAIVAFTAALVALAARNSRQLAASAGAAMAERARVVQVFGRYVDAGIAHGVLAGELEAETREVTVLFTDLREFTALAEQLEPAETLALLNAHYDALVPLVHRHGGAVNKFIGDAVMATFGAPAPAPDHARRAVEAAIAMLEAQDALNARLRAGGRPELIMAVGVATGPAVLGTLGAADRIEYAVIGDTVNTAARLEGLNKQLGTRLLFSEATRRALGDDARVRALGEHPLKGKARAVGVFTLS